MFFLAATGKIDPHSIMVNDGHIVFTLDVDGSNRYRVRASGIEQCDLIKSIRPGESIFLLGTAENKKKITITPWLVMRLDDIDEVAKISRQILKNQL